MRRFARSAAAFQAIAKKPHFAGGDEAILQQTRERKTGRLGLLGAMMGVDAAMSSPIEGSLLRTYRRMQAAQLEAGASEILMARVCSDTPGWENREREHDEAQDREEAARLDLIRAIADMAGYDFAAPTDLEIREQAVLARAWEGNWLFMLAVNDRNGCSPQDWTLGVADHLDEYLRPLVVDLGEIGKAKA